jgi:hypothetical protein
MPCRRHTADHSATNAAVTEGMGSNYERVERLKAPKRQRIRLITGQRRYLRRRLCAMGVYSIDSHANFVYLPGARWSWPDVFDSAGLKVRDYADGGARITIGRTGIHHGGIGSGEKPAVTRGHARPQPIQRKRLSHRGPRP